MLGLSLLVNLLRFHPGNLSEPRLKSLLIIVCSELPGGFDEALVLVAYVRTILHSAPPK
jgi:hypothetical protein